MTDVGWTFLLRAAERQCNHTDPDTVHLEQPEAVGSGVACSLMSGTRPTSKENAKSFASESEISGLSCVAARRASYCRMIGKANMCVEHACRDLGQKTLVRAMPMNTCEIVSSRDG